MLTHSTTSRTFRRHMRDWWNVPNVLTYFRLAVVPLFAVCFGYHWYGAALILFFLAGFTDLVDGSIARWLNQRSELGAILDPIADKTLMWAAYVCLASVRIVPWWLVWLMFLKDAVVLGGIGVLRWRKIRITYTPVVASKLATLSQIITGTFGLIDFTLPGHAFGVYPVSDFVAMGIYLTAALMLVTTLDYLRKGLELVQTRPQAGGRKQEA